MNDIYYMRQAMKQAKKAFNCGEVPVGALIVKSDKIISRAYNKKNKSKLTINHAEILAIIKANRKIGDWRLNGCTLYVTLKPCDMCMGAIEEARISKVVYLGEKMYNPKKIECKKVKDANLNIDNEKILKEFFLVRR